MLKEWVKEPRPTDEELGKRLEKARTALAARQMMIKEKKKSKLYFLIVLGLVLKEIKRIMIIHLNL